MQAETYHLAWNVLHFWSFIAKISWYSRAASVWLSNHHRKSTSFCVCWKSLISCLHWQLRRSCTAPWSSDQFEPPLPARARLTDEQQASLTKAISLGASTTAESRGWQNIAEATLYKWLTGSKLCHQELLPAKEDRGTNMPHTASHRTEHREQSGQTTFPPPAAVAAVRTPGKHLCCWISKAELKIQKRHYLEWFPLCFHSNQWVGWKLQTLSSESSRSVQGAFCFSILGANLHSTIFNSVWIMVLNEHHYSSFQ